MSDQFNSQTGDADVPNPLEAQPPVVDPPTVSELAASNASAQPETLAGREDAPDSDTQTPETAVPISSLNAPHEKADPHERTVGGNQLDPGQDISAERAPPVVGVIATPVAPSPPDRTAPPFKHQVAREQSALEVTAHVARASSKRVRWYAFPFWCLGRCWDLACLLVLLAVVAVVPIVQLASLGYLLNSAAVLARGGRFREALPGRRTAGLLGSFLLLATILWAPVWLVTDLSYSAQLLQPNSSGAAGWRVAAFITSGLWIIHIGWAAMRGGRWWHLVWPAPIRFIKHSWRRDTWRQASDRLYEWVAGFQFPRLWWLGARAAVAALLWIAIPVSMMIIGLRAYELDIAGLIGLLGAASMMLIMLYLPFLQIQLAVDDRFSSILKVSTVRKRFRHAPIAHSLALISLCLLCLPLYLLRIEATPSELLWAPSLVFVIFMLPAKLLLGAAMGYAERRKKRGLSARHWVLRWPARFAGLAAVAIYVGAQFVVQLVAGQGALVMYFQHAFLVPAPLISS